MLFSGKWRQKVFVLNCRVFLQLPAGIPIKDLPEKSVEDVCCCFCHFHQVVYTQVILCCHHQKLKHSGSRIGQNILDTYAGKMLLSF